MTEDASAPPASAPPARGSDGRQYRAWDGTLWNDRDSRDVHNHTHPTGSTRDFAPLSWTDDGEWGSIKG